MGLEPEVVSIFPMATNLLVLLSCVACVPHHVHDARHKAILQSRFDMVVIMQVQTERPFCVYFDITLTASIYSLVIELPWKAVLLPR